MIFDSGSTDNLASIKVVDKLKLKTMKHPTPYKVSWLQKGYQFLVNEQCEVELQLVKYREKILKYEKGVMHDGKRNSYKFSKDGVNHTFFPMEEEDTLRMFDPENLLLSGKEHSQ